ncbi:MAG: M28 family peptidase, partial [Actinomycetia bacterium]|nr:M28 family peptidase [Actinomycetes bacterium]
MVLVGGHYDHIGNGEGLGSLAKQGEEGKIHNGADDNASGTSVVLELASALTSTLRTGDESHR